MLEAIGLTKRYGDQIALHPLDLRIEPGEIYCLLGANGAGKTTTINLFLNFIDADGGQALIHGLDVAREPLASKRHVAYIPEQVNLYGTLSGLENLRYFAALALGASLLWFRPMIAQGGAGGSVVQSIVEMVLDIVPKNIVDPFQTGNTLQILFLGAVVGVGMILLRDQMQVMNQVVEQSNAIVQLVLSAIGGMVPGFIFLSVLRLVLRGELAANAASLAKMLALTLILLAANAALHVCSLLREGVRPGAALKKLLPTALVALSTGSSAAAYPANRDCCENKLGISPKLTRFAIPFGSVVFMPQIAMTMVYVPVFAASLYGVPLSWGGLVLCAVNAVVLAVAAPPIPGGAIACYTLMFLQLGIPLEAISIAATANVVLDFVDTCGNLLGLQVQLVHGARSMGLLDERVLKQ